MNEHLILKYVNAQMLEAKCSLLVMPQKTGLLSKKKKKELLFKNNLQYTNDSECQKVR